MVEHHVDESEDFQARMNIEPFGGNLSVRLSPNVRPLIIVGHDECIFKQYLITTKAWTLPTGQSQLVPKDEGSGVMISAFQSREFGFGHPLNQQQLQAINELRRGKTYVDKEAAERLKGNIRKTDLKNNNPLVYEFEYGMNNEGYWDYDHMVLQLDDCVDCLKYLYPNYDILFMLDHSSGHDKQKPDGLNASKMQVNYGGKQSHLRDSVISQVDGYLGPFHHEKMLKVGDTQSFVFKADDEGPFYLSDPDKEARKFDVQSGIRRRNLTKAELANRLNEQNISIMGTKKQLVERCTENNIPTSVEEPKIIEGWINKPKGKLQILWERGWIDVDNLNKYTNDGRVDAFGILDKSFSLHHLMLNCKDFIEEESMLQWMGRQMGVMIDRTPICHAEFAGEGIEYTWGCAKNHYRRQPLSSKRGKETYRELVKQCLSRNNLTTDRVRLFARRARSYICAYYQKHYIGVTDPEILHGNPPEIVQIEKLAKKFKSHRSAIDFSSGFITGVIQSTSSQVTV